MDVSIIIVNYNTSQLIVNCIESIKEKTHSLTYEIIVVDNASSDGSLKRCEGLLNDKLFFHAGESLGFLKANNFGTKPANGIRKNLYAWMEEKKLFPYSLGIMPPFWTVALIRMVARWRGLL